MARLKAFDETEVLNKAVQLFWHRGFNNTSYSQIVKHLGINRSSIYDTYGNKEALFIAALKHYLKSSHGGKSPSFEEPRALIDSFFQEKLEAIRIDKNKKGCFAVNCTVELAAQADDENSQLFEV
ncbi:MAG: TetR/AcrR family transcriptional regulator, partial [Bacteroidota bacterium]